jgi:DNA-binding winged helix-turn-helix (wHTH) protein
MIFTFANFTLNSDNKELHCNNEKVVLTKQNYDLLLFFVNNHEAVVSKDEIIDKVWNGKIVTHNTVDKSFTKLKKVLNQHQQMDYFESQYGLGMKFLPAVTTPNNNKEILTKNQVTKGGFPVLPLLILLGVFIVSAVYFLSKSSQPIQNIENNTPVIAKPLLLILPNHDNSANSQWWSANNNKLIEQILGENHTTLIKDYENKPANLNTQQYLEHQWKISPQLKVLSTNIVKENDRYTLDFKLTDKNQIVSIFSTSHKNFNILYSQANKWLLEKLHSEEIENSKNA